ncbi:MAG: Ig-like domain-containing protein [Deltaproteobacteria bacterium]
MPSARLFIAAGALVAGVSLACSSDSLTDSNAPPGLALKLAPSIDTIFIADTITSANSVALSLSATSLGRSVTTPTGVEWSSSDPGVAVVSPSGVVTPVAIGATTITARVNAERATTTVVVAFRATRLAIAPTTLVGLAGDTVLVSASALDPAGTLVAGTVYSFSSGDPTTAAVAQTGTRAARVVFLKPGNARVNVTAAGQTATATGTIQPRDFISAPVSGAPAGALTISAGDDATCGLLPFGRAYCFGRGGLLGIAKDTSCFGDTGSGGLQPCTLIPLRIAGSLNLTSVSVGDSVACGATADNRAYCWGSNSAGQLGNGSSSTGTSAAPNLVIGAVSGGAMSLARVAAGGNHACGLTPSGAAWCWGSDAFFQLGNGDGLRDSSTTPIPVAGGQNFSTITAGTSHTCALRADGAAYCWGDNSSGQLGAGAIGSAADAPVLVSGGLAFASLSAGGNHTCGITRAGAAFCWGGNESGQLGHGDNTDFYDVPMQVTGNRTFRSISVNSGSACGVTTGGAAVCWGGNDYGQLGNGVSLGTPSSSPVALGADNNGVTHSDFTAVTVGRRHACAVAPSGAYCWGSNVFGALGNELQALKQPTPQKTATPQ